MKYSAYPRLDDWGASRLLAELAPLSAAELAAEAAPFSKRTHFHPTARSRVTEAELMDFRSRALRAFAGLSETAEGRRDFDRNMGRLLATLQDLSPSEAGRREVWNHMSLVVLPDLVFWRWPTKDGGRPSRERLLGSPRNALRRLWWRQYLLGEDLVEFLSEDELVGITERTSSIGSSPKVARAFAGVLRVAVERGRVPAPLREDLARSYARAVLRRGAVLALPAMSTPQLEYLFRTVLNEVLREQGVIAPGGGATSARFGVRSR